MKICAIISEYNPFHNGHKYQIEQIKRNMHDCLIISIMSGNFVQRGEPAIFDKYSRTLTALENGIDMVIELPPTHSINNSDMFAKSSFEIIKLLNIVTHFSFGCEIADIQQIKEISLLDENYKNNSNNSYIKNFDTIHSTNKMIFNSNLILAKDYLKYCGDIQPIIIKRVGSNYNEFRDNEYMSATHIRKSIVENNSTKYISIEDFSTIIKYKLYFNTISDINSRDYKLLNRIKQNLYNTNTIEDLVAKSYAKNISKSTIKRFLMKMLLELNNIKPSSYINILGCKKEYTYLIKSFSKIANHNKNFSLLDDETKNTYELNNIADKLYYEIFNEKYNEFISPSNSIIIV